MTTHIDITRTTPYTPIFNYETQTYTLNGVPYTGHFFQEIDHTKTHQWINYNEPPNLYQITHRHTSNGKVIGDPTNVSINSSGEVYVNGKRVH